MLKTTTSYEATSKPEVEKFVVRLPGGMRGRIAVVARQSRRSMNSEIIARLEQSLADTPLIQTVQETAARPPLRAVEDKPAGGEEQRLLQAFRNLPASKREAILNLLE